MPPEGTPDCSDHLSDEARAELRRLVETLVSMGVISNVDRAVLAAYCQAYGRWVEAEQKLNEALFLFRTASGYVHQWPRSGSRRPHGRGLPSPTWPTSPSRSTRSSS